MTSFRSKLGSAFITFARHHNDACKPVRGWLVPVDRDNPAGAAALQHPAAEDRDGRVFRFGKIMQSREPSFSLQVRLLYLEKQEANLRRTLITGALVASALSMSTMAMAQGGAAGGAVGGAIIGGVVGGPVGAAVGAAAGATAGGIAEDARPRFHSYVVERRHPSYRYQNEVRVGAELPDSGVTYYEVPREYGTTQYRYTVVNDRTVLVDPGTHRIVQVVE
jgi:hypothetical protein